MAYDGKLLARARERLEEQRANNQAEQARRLAQVYRKVPEIERIDSQMKAQMARLVRLTISRAPDIAEQIAALKDENLDLQMRRAELLVEHGCPIDYLDEIVSCPKCKDSGRVDGRVCDCLERLYNRELTKELSTLLKTGNESFDRFDLSLYDAAPIDGSGIVPRQAMEIVYNTCRHYADTFPNKAENLLFQGGTGLGKTFLSACIARRVADRGFSVCYDSAVAALEAFEQQKFARDSAAADAAEKRVRRMLDCDLMILDDLGTEVLTSVSSSALYTLLNTRLSRGKRIIVSTNLSDEELAKRYSQQIASRLAGEFLHLPFVGRDIRLLRR